MMSDEQELLQQSLAGLSPEERAQVLKILQQYAQEGESALEQDIKWADWEEIPVDIETFLHDKQYLGKGLYDNEGRFTVFPYWEEKLKEVFPTNTTTQYNNIVLTGSIGIGKSFFAVLCILYMLYRLLCLKDPYTFFGMQLIDKLSISFMNITIENAKGVALDKMNQLILSSEWFMAHGEMRGTTNLVYHPDKHIEFIASSSNNQIVGRAIFCNFSDEVNFSLTSNIEKAKKKMLKIITQVDARMRSRFLRGTYLPTLNILASSKDTDQAFLDDYIKNKQETNSQTTLIVNEPQWVVDDRKNSDRKFWVAVGNKFLSNELLPLDVSPEKIEEMRGQGYDMWEVPIGYLETFQQNLDEAICSIIGIATASTLKYISGERLNQTKTDSYQNPFTKDIIEVGNGIEDHYQYSNFFDLSKVASEDLRKPLFMHLDLSLSGDMTGIAGVWIDGWRQTAKVIPGQTSSEDEISYSRDLQYKLAFSVSVKAPKGFQVSFEKTRNFIRWLREQGFDIKVISSDTFNSANIRQDLAADGFKTEILSVDRVEASTKTQLAYAYFKTAIYERRIKIYKKCDLLTKEITELEKLSDGHIEHQNAGKTGSKDQCDAVCGSLYMASKYSEQYSYEYGDQLIEDISVNLDTDGQTSKAEFIKNLEDTLVQIWQEENKAMQVAQRQDQEEQQFMQDLMDGIISL